jgi:hypothetical protein
MSYISARAAISKGSARSPFVHSTTSPASAAYFATSKGSRDGRVVKIDLAHPLLQGLRVIDVSTQEAALQHGLVAGERAYHFAVQFHEVLLEGAIPAEAIVGVFDVFLADLDYGQKNASLNIFREAMPKPLEDQMVTEWHAVETFFVDVALRECRHTHMECYHFSRDCPRCAQSAEATDPEEGVPAGVRACTRCLMRGFTGFEATGPAEPTGTAEPPGTPTPATRIFFTTRTGKKFHLRRNCSGLRNANSIFEASECPADLTSCSLCAI